MRILCVHSDPFSFRVTEKTKFAEEVKPPVVSSAEVKNALVVFVSIERQDEKLPEEAAEAAIEEIRTVMGKTGAGVVVVYPYSHLTNRLARPAGAMKILKFIREGLEEIECVFAPFGWYKAFNLNGKGHSLSELSRVIDHEKLKLRERAMSGGREHPVMAMSQKFREVFLESGLDEMINPAIIDDIHVYKQYGPEAPLILDRVFYLAGLDRADISLNKGKLKAIYNIMPEFDKEEELKGLLREYKEALVEADNFLEELALRLHITDEQAGTILDRAFPEFKELKAVVTKRALRSDMTSNWFSVLERNRSKMPLPIRLFSVGSRFRREQRQDSTHLLESTSASAVVMDQNLTLEDGRKLARDILQKMGFQKCTFQKKKIASRYYVPETDTEVFINYEGRPIEIGNFGFYTTASLSSYNLDIPVFNMDFGVERMALILTGAKDIHALVYPQLYEEVSFSDSELAKMLSCAEQPEAPELCNAIPQMISIAVKEKDLVGPAEIMLYMGRVKGKELKISVFNWDEGKPLLSMAAMNWVFVHAGCVYGLPEDRHALGDKYLDIYKDGIKTNLRFIDMIIKGFVAEAEKKMESGEESSHEESWKISKRPFQVNLNIQEAAYDFIQRQHKSIRVGGPLFFGMKAEWK